MAPRKQKSSPKSTGVVVLQDITLQRAHEEQGSPNVLPQAAVVEQTIESIPGPSNVGAAIAEINAATVNVEDIELFKEFFLTTPPKQADVIILSDEELSAEAGATRSPFSVFDDNNGDFFGPPPPPLRLISEVLHKNGKTTNQQEQQPSLSQHRSQKGKRPHKRGKDMEVLRNMCPTQLSAFNDTDDSDCEFNTDNKKPRTVLKQFGMNFKLYSEQYSSKIAKLQKKLEKVEQKKFNLQSELLEAQSEKKLVDKVLNRLGIK